MNGSGPNRNHGSEVFFSPSPLTHRCPPPGIRSRCAARSRISSAPFAPTKGLESLFPRAIQARMSRSRALEFLGDSARNCLPVRSRNHRSAQLSQNE